MRPTGSLDQRAVSARSPRIISQLARSRSPSYGPPAWWCAPLSPAASLRGPTSRNSSSPRHPQDGYRLVRAGQTASDQLGGFPARASPPYTGFAFGGGSGTRPRLPLSRPGDDAEALLGIPESCSAFIRASAARARSAAHRRTTALDLMLKGKPFRGGAPSRSVSSINWCRRGAHAARQAAAARGAAAKAARRSSRSF